MDKHIKSHEEADQEPPTAVKDCLQCRIIGTAAFLGISAYALHIQYDQMRDSIPPNSNQSFPLRLQYSIKNGPRWLSVVSLSFAGLAAARWLS